MEGAFDLKLNSQLEKKPSTKKETDEIK